MNKLSSRAIIGQFYKRLNQNSGMEWIEAISNYFTSDQDTEEPGTRDRRKGWSGEAAHR